MAESHPWEKPAALVAAAGCIVITTIVWRELAPYQPMWPFPAMYFVEVMALGAAAAGFFLWSHAERTVIGWIATGAFTAFAILGAWTVGMLYVPSAVGFAAASALSAVRQRTPALKSISIFASASLVQAALMLIMARLV